MTFTYCRIFAQITICMLYHTGKPCMADISVLLGIRPFVKAISRGVEKHYQPGDSETRISSRTGFKATTGGLHTCLDTVTVTMSSDSSVKRPQK